MKPLPILNEPANSPPQRAEAAVTASPADITAMSAEELQRLVHDLRIHQTELRTRNEELLQARAELEFSRDRFRELFDFAPFGYVTLGPDAMVIEANLTLANMLGRDREDLVARKFTRVIAPDSQDTLYLHLLSLIDSPGKRACDLRLFRADGEILDMRVESTAPHDGRTGLRRFHCALIDVTERNHAERYHRSGAEKNDNRDEEPPQ